MKKIILVILLISTLNTFSSELFKFQLAKDEKLEGTYSAEFGSNKTIHVALIKNSETGKFLFSPYLVDENNKVSKLESFVMSKKLQILSYHLNDDVATFSNYDEEEKLLYVIDFNLTTGKSKSITTKLNQKADNIFRFQDKTIFVFFDKKLGISFKTIKNTVTKFESSINVSSEKLKVFKSAVNALPEAVNQTEYVENGSIQKAKTYIVDNKLIMTFETDKHVIEIFKFDLNESLFSASSISPYSLDSLRDFSNYVFDNKIATLGVNAKDASLSFYDVGNLNKIATLSLASIVDEPILKDFIKTTSKFSFRPTLTINKNINGKYILRIDNVDENTYSYNYNWWFHQWFFQQQMWHQQMMMNQMRMNQMNFSRGGFGPNVNFLEDDRYFFKDQKKAIQIVLDLDLNTVLNDTKETQMKYIDRDDYVDKYKQNGRIKEFSSSFTKDEFRYIYQDKKSKVITIFSEKI
ncbi:hypothetical protein [Flavobacterium sp. H122]|uniref:hypothetical protein n=1 Tax=Flavobacterium sp. H122 TaxID=2529860 RepID=UPI0010AA8EDB|nr:hypothetical protein [Flavobacterium sp. H122]